MGHRRTDAALMRDNCLLPSKNRQQRMRRITKGWMFLVQWKDGSSNRILLEDLKDSNTTEAAAYVVVHKKADEPAFGWWARKFSGSGGGFRQSLGSQVLAHNGEVQSQSPEDC